MSYSLGRVFTGYKFQFSVAIIVRYMFCLLRLILTTLHINYFTLRLYLITKTKDKTWLKTGHCKSIFVVKKNGLLLYLVLFTGKK